MANPDLILFGIQGAGKGTQARLLAKKFQFTIFETGQELRQLAKEQTPLGQKIRSITASGKLVSDEIVLEIVRNFLQKNSGRLIFDGIPRSKSQKNFLEQELKKNGRQAVALVLTLEDPKISLQRLLARKTCAKCAKIFGAADQVQELTICPTCGGQLKVRADDNAAAIQERIKIYEQETKPLLQEYQTEERLIEVSADQSIEAVTQEIEQRLAGYGKLNFLRNLKQSKILQNLKRFFAGI